MSQFVDSLAEVFAQFGAIKTRRMFGGVGVYHQGLMFGLVHDDVLYLKVDEASAGAFVEQGSVPFEPEMRGKRVKMSYYTAPEGMLDDLAEARTWAARAFEAALRAKQRTPVRTPRAK